jgi:hypothetical protein
MSEQTDNNCNIAFYLSERGNHKYCSNKCKKAAQEKYLTKEKDAFEKIFINVRGRIHLRKSRTSLTETAKIELCDKILFDLKQLKKALGNGTNIELLKAQFIEFFAKNEKNDNVKWKYKYPSDLLEMEQEINEELSEYARKK